MRMRTQESIFRAEYNRACVKNREKEAGRKRHIGTEHRGVVNENKRRG